MKIITPHKEQLTTVLHQNKALQLYSIGDLDAPFFQRCSWWGVEGNTSSGSVLLLFDDGNTGTLLIMQDTHQDSQPILQHLTAHALPSLPDTLHAIISANATSWIERFFTIHDTHATPLFRMMLSSYSQLEPSPHPKIATPDDHDELLQFLHTHYPQTYFNPDTLALNVITILRDTAAPHPIIATCGVHVYSLTQQVAALGNVVVHPDHRNKGLARQVVSTCCQHLLTHGITHIGLNVAQSNIPALRSYASLGFEITHELLECDLSKIKDRSV